MRNFHDSNFHDSNYEADDVSAIAGGLKKPQDLTELKNTD